MPTLLFDEEFYYLFCNDIFNILSLNIIYLQNYKNFSYLSTTFVALFDKKCIVSSHHPSIPPKITTSTILL